jgi:hypothetical protein
MTAVEWLVKKYFEDYNVLLPELEYAQAKQIEKEHIINAMLHALDEDGHTGDWKIKFVNNYYDKTFK